MQLFAGSVFTVENGDLVGNKTDKEEEHAQDGHNDSAVGKTLCYNVAVNPESKPSGKKDQTCREKYLQGIKKHYDPQDKQDGLGTVLQELHVARSSLARCNINGHGSDRVAFLEESQG